MREAVRQKKIRAVFNTSGTGVRVWRNNVGAKMIDGQWLTWGLAVGSGDLIGLRSVVITPDMVGKTIGVFFSAEIKTDTGRLSGEQAAWQQTIRKLGGIAETFRTEEEAREWMTAELKI